MMTTAINTTDMRAARMSTVESGVLVAWWFMVVLVFRWFYLS